MQMEVSSLGVTMTTVSGDCKKHGHWQAESGTYNGHAFIKHCPECSKEARIEDELRKDEDAKQKCRDRQIKRGVTDRHLDAGLDTYKAETDAQKSSLSAVREVLDSAMAKKMRNLIMIGSVGTGKTHLGQSLVVEMTKAWKDARYTTLSRMIRYVRGSWGRDSEYSEHDAYAKLTSPDLLVIDEVGVQAGTDNERNILFEVINERYEEKKSTVIICNLTKDELSGALGDRTIDRLRENGRMIGMTWESARK